jgi:hypothetical protein
MLNVFGRVHTVEIAPIALSDSEPSELLDALRRDVDGTLTGR